MMPLWDCELSSTPRVTAKLLPLLRLLLLRLLLLRLLLLRLLLLLLRLLRWGWCLQACSAAAAKEGLAEVQGGVWGPWASALLPHRVLQLGCLTPAHHVGRPCRRRVLVRHVLRVVLQLVLLMMCMLEAVHVQLLLLVVVVLLLVQLLILLLLLLLVLPPHLPVLPQLVLGAGVGAGGAGGGPLLGVLPKQLLLQLVHGMRRLLRKLPPRHLLRLLSFQAEERLLQTGRLLGRLLLLQARDRGQARLLLLWLSRCGLQAGQRRLGGGGRGNRCSAASGPLRV